MRKFLVLLFLIPLFANSQVYNKGLILHGDTLFLCSGNGDSVRVNNNVHENYSLRAYKFLGLTVDIKAEPLGLNINNITTASGLTDGIALFVAVYLPYADTITGVTWFQATSGDYTADEYNGVGLYTISGGTLTLVASSANDGNIWKGATGQQTKAFSTPYFATPGVYFIAYLYNSSGVTTSPSTGNGQTLNGGSNAIFPNSTKLLSTYVTTTLPATLAMSATTTVGIAKYFALYK